MPFTIDKRKSMLKSILSHLVKYVNPIAFRKEEYGIA